MANTVVAESSKARKTPKVLHHLEVHPEMGGGVRVEHHYAGFALERLLGRSYIFRENNVGLPGKRR